MVPFELVNADITDKDIHNRYTKTTENIILYISKTVSDDNKLILHKQYISVQCVCH